MQHGISLARATRQLSLAEATRQLSLAEAIRQLSLAQATRQTITNTFLPIVAISKVRWA